jgi:acyl carrier protein
MDKIELREKIKGVLISVLQHDKFEMVNELSAKDVDGWDSLTHMIIITEIESLFGVRFKLKELNKLNNLGNLIDLVHGKLNEKY